MRVPTFSFLLLIVLVTGTMRPALAIVSFGPPAAISSYAAIDNPVQDSAIDSESSPALAGDGVGNWVAIWRGTAGPPLQDPPSPGLWISRSADNGLTWTNTTSLVVSPVSGIGDLAIATDRAGVWIALYKISYDNEVSVVRSIDNGATWSAPVQPLGTGANDARIVTDQTGTWVMVASLGAESIIAVRSIDNGQTWGAPVVIDPLHSLVPDLATDRAGNWVAIWQRGNLGAPVALARSTDNAATWQTPVVIGNLGAYGNSLQSGSVVVATDLQSRWVAIWENTPALTEQEFRYSVSSDSGATWSPSASFPATSVTDKVYDRKISIETAQDGTIYAAWDSTRGQVDYDVVMARSIDGGVTWTTPSAVNLLGLKDGNAEDYGVYLGYDGSNTWIAAWTSLNSLGGTIGEDNDILFARALDNCPSVPTVGCKTSTRSEGSRLRIKDDFVGAKDRITWTWTAGEQTLAADLGDPTTTSSYVLCAYDNDGGGYRPVLESHADAAADCNAVPCWTGDSTSYAYRDSGHRNGSLTRLEVAAGDEGRAKVKLKAAGEALGPPHMPLAKNPSVVVQLTNLETSACWEATYSAATVNLGPSFKASSD